MKKALFIVGALLALGIVAAVTFWVVLKDELVQRITDEATAGLDATVELGPVGLSLLRSFPDVTLTAEGVKVIGKGAFEGIPLADIGALQFTVDIMSVVGGQTLAVESFELVAPRIKVVVLEDGQANYDIAPSTQAQAPEGDEEGEGGTGFSVALRRYALNGASLIYDDRQADIYVELSGLDHTGRGDFTQDVFDLEMLTSIASLTLREGGVAYFDKTRVEAKTNLLIDLPESRYTFKENELRLNALVLGFDGWVAMPGEAINMDLSFEARETAFKQLLSMVPSVYMADLAGVKTDGTLALTGSAKGAYLGEQLPAFRLALSVKDGMFQYPDLPKAATNIQVDMAINNPGGAADATVVDIRRCHLELGASPIDLRLRTSTPLSDPNIDGQVVARLDLASLKEVLPLQEGEAVAGKITSDITLKGRQSAIDEGRYDDVHASGSLVIQGLRYTSADQPWAALIHKAQLNFTPAFVEVPSFDASLGKSDLQLSGKVENHIAYALRDEALRGSFALTSRLMDLDELAGGASEEPADDGAAASTGDAILVPENLDLTLTARIGTLRYDGMEMRDATGALRIRGGEMQLDAFTMQMLGGTVVVDGVYSTTDPAQPRVDFGLDVTRLDLPQTYATFGTVQTLVPIAQGATGAFSTKLALNARFNKEMEPVLQTLEGQGRVTTHNIALTSTGALSKVAAQLTLEQLRAITLNNVRIQFAFNDGRVEVAPFDFRAGDVNVQARGSHGLDQSLAYDLVLDAPSAALGAAATAAGGLLAPLGDTLPKRVSVDVHIGGTAADPKVQISLKNQAGSAKDQLKVAAEAQLGAAKAQLLETAAAVKDEAAARLAAEAEKLRSEAQKQAQAVRDQAAKAAKEAQKSGYASADELVKQAKNPLAKAAAEETAKKMKKEADEKAKQIVAKGNQEAQKILDAAEEQIKTLK